MDKNKIIKTYLDFWGGKFFSSTDRINFSDLKKKSIKLFDKYISEIDFNDSKLLSSDNQSLISQKCLGFAENFKFKNDRESLKEILQLTHFSMKYNYHSIYSNKKHKVANENVYVVSNKIFDYFLNIPLPENFNEIDYNFKSDLPAIFIFENGNIGYLSYISNHEKTELNLLVFGEDHINRYFCGYIIFSSDFLYNSMNPEYYKKNMSEKDLKQSEKYIRSTQDMIHFMSNLMLFLKVKDTLDIKSSELNQSILEAQKNVNLGKNLNRNNQIISQSESYKFIDLDLTLSEYSREYQLKNPRTESSTMKPHWRTGHYHSYWTGKKDGTEEKKRIIKFIPTLWIGDPSQMQDQTIFKVVK